MSRFFCKITENSDKNRHWREIQIICRDHCEGDPVIFKLSRNGVIIVNVSVKAILDFMLFKNVEYLIAYAIRIYGREVQKYKNGKLWRLFLKLHSSVYAYLKSLRLTRNYFFVIHLTNCFLLLFVIKPSA